MAFDACLMNMVEIAYQLRQYTKYIVGSEQTEPGEGWPYDSVLSVLVAKPAIDAANFGAAIVKRYIDSYRHEDVTQSLLDLAHAKEVAEAVDALAKALISAIKNPSEYAAVTKAAHAAQHYEYADFQDLHDLCAQLYEKVSSKKVRNAATAVIKVLNGVSPFVAASRSKGRGVAKSYGVSIYFPTARDVTVAYPQLDFAKNTAWGDFLTVYQKS